MIDEMIANLKKEQWDDDFKRTYSEKSLHETDDTKKVLQLSISKSEQSTEVTESTNEKRKKVEDIEKAF